jgi:DNA-binding NarL/FixJ family response regulator
LSEKRRAVLTLAAGGKQNKEIAFALGITERTVKDHWAKIFARLEVANRAEAVSRALRLGLI